MHSEAGCVSRLIFVFNSFTTKLLKPPGCHTKHCQAHQQSCAVLHMHIKPGSVLNVLSLTAAPSAAAPAHPRFLFAKLGKAHQESQAAAGQLQLDSQPDAMSVKQLHSQTPACKLTSRAALPACISTSVCSYCSLDVPDDIYNSQLYS
jgi:hypothetical protein